MRATVSALWRSCAFLALAGAFASASCYRDDHTKREKEPPPGYPGGFCLAPGGTCYEGACDIPGGGYCYDPSDPCNGVFCGGNGTCLPNAENLPTCLCDFGFNNDNFSLFCEMGGGSTAPTTDDPMPDMGG